MAAATANWRTIDVDALDPESPANFAVAELAPAVAHSSAADVQAATAHVRQALRGGDGEGALRDALALAPFGAEERGKVRRSLSFFPPAGIAEKGKSGEQDWSLGLYLAPRGEMAKCGGLRESVN
jgi:hypothetical protein